MGITAPLTTPYYSGAGVTSEVPGLYPMAIDGHPYFLDLTSTYYRPRFQRSSITLLRSQADIGKSPSEGSLNPDDLWRRPDETWHKGAGQKHLDRPDSDEARFNASKGVDPWTKWQLGLLPDTANKKSSANTNLYLVYAGGRAYVTDGNNIAYTTDVTAGSPTWTNLTGIPAANPTSICSDGYYVYTSHTASGIYLTNTGSGATAQWISPGTITLVRYAKGRLMAAAANNLYNITVSAATPGPTTLVGQWSYAHPNPQWIWVDIAEGQGQIYAAGYAGDKSLIYRTAVKSDGTALDVPVVAGELPDGEIVRSIQGYLGFLVVGTDLGVRFAAIDSQGNLTLGSLLRTAVCQCFEPQDRFVWFGWNNYDSSSTGLGRMDLSTFTAPLTPAYASDLMASAQGAVLSVVTVFQGTPTQELRLFTVSGSGVFSQISNKVASGTIDSGQITYGIFDKKFAVFLDVRTTPIAGSYEGFISIDDSAFTSIGVSLATDTNGRVFGIGPKDGRKFEIRLQLNRDTNVLTTGPTIVRNTLRSYPAPRRVEEFVLPIQLHETLDLGASIFSMDVRTELNRLISILNDRRQVVLQLGSESFNILIEDYQFHPHHPTADRSYWNGWVIIRAKTITE